MPTAAETVKVLLGWPRCPKCDGWLRLPAPRTGMPNASWWCRHRVGPSEWDVMWDWRERRWKTWERGSYPHNWRRFDAPPPSIPHDHPAVRAAV